MHLLSVYRVITKRLARLECTYNQYTGLSRTYMVRMHQQSVYRVIKKRLGRLEST